jgi:hypothetical protein
MADDSKLPNIGGNGFVWILLAVAGTYFATHPLPLSGSRPAGTDRTLVERVGEQHVDARLWQDPFAAVADQVAKSPDLKPENCHRLDRYPDIATYCRPPWKDKSGVPILVLVASTTGTPYAEDQESRRRRRYAVLAGLDAEGFVPEDSQHIGFYWPQPPVPRPDPVTVHVVVTSVDRPEIDLPASSTKTDFPHGNVPISPAKTESRQDTNASPSPAASRPELPKIVPYEWFQPRPERPDVVASYQHILLLWFDEDVLAAPDHATPPPLHPAPLRQYAELLCSYLDRQKTGSAEVKILGPQLSTTLKAMVDEITRSKSEKDWASGACAGSEPPAFYVSQATVSDATLLPKCSDGSCPSYPSLKALFEKKRIPLHRLTATDDALALAIGEELGRRDIKFGENGGPQVALISEWDTLYGRALPDAMARCLGRSSCEAAGGNPFLEKKWLHPFAYVRGLDGQMPTAGGIDSANGGKDRGSKPDGDNKDSGKNRPDPNVKARAEGQSQFDYLQRLGDSVRQLDADLRLENTGGIQAVGVLGSDLYDKLLVLQALRPLLPNARFFTTDLDALLLHPAEQKVTRNLLVASGFGLQLRPDVQGAIPPFRSNYQTAEFLAARIAVRSNKPPSHCWTDSPRLFEIGSSRAFQFAETSALDPSACEAVLRDCEEGPSATSCTPARKETRRFDHSPCKNQLTDCSLIHPVATAMLPQMRSKAFTGLAVIALLIGVGLATIPPAIQRFGRPRVESGVEPQLQFSRSTRVLVFFGSLVILGTALVWFASPGDWLTRGGEPILLFEGITVWPTILLRSATLALCIWLLLYSLDKLDANMRQIERDLHLEQTTREAERRWAALPFAMKLAYGLGYDSPDTERDDVSHFWCKYYYRGEFWPRLGRVTIGVFAVWLFYFLLTLIFDTPSAPTRGGLSEQLYSLVTSALFLCTLALIFFVADATWLCRQLTRDIRPATVFWPEQTLNELKQQYGLSREALADCLDLRFLAQRSKCITALLYGPFLIIALIVVSQGGLPAQYGRSIPAFVAVGVALLVVIGCVVALRMSAEATRAAAHRRLTERLLRAKGCQDGGPVADQLELVLRRIGELREGAFSPFAQQPVVRAMLLPLGGFGGTALLNYLVGPGFA